MTDSTPPQTPERAAADASPAPEPMAAAPAAVPGTAPGWERETLERLLFATVEEQRAVRRWRNFWRLVWVLLAGLAVALALGHGAPTANKSTAHTAVVEIKGEIADGANASAEYVVAAMRSAFEDEGAQAVVLLINSPGGSPVQAGIINDEIHRLK